MLSILAQPLLQLLQMEYLRALRWILLQRSMGPVVVSIIWVLKDVFCVFLLFLVFYAAFAVGILTLLKSFVMEPNGKYTVRLEDNKTIENSGICRCVSISRPGLVTHSVRLSVPKYVNLSNGLLCVSEWYLMVPDGTQWCQMLPTVTQCIPIVPNGTQWYPLVPNATQRYPFVTNGTQWSTNFKTNCDFTHQVVPRTCY